MYIRMNKNASGIACKPDENGTTTTTLRTGKFYEVGEEVQRDRADQIVAEGGAVFTDTNDRKRAKEVEIERRDKLRTAYEQQVAEDIAAIDARALRRQGLVKAETTALTAKGVRA